MRHKIAGNRLGRNSKWRQATIRDIAKATLLQQRVKTTEAKAKEARKLVDKLITLGKKGSLAHKRRAFAILCNHKVVSELFNIIAVRFGQRNGGYTRIIKLAAHRRGDNAKLVFLELTEQAQAPVKDVKTDKKKFSKKTKSSEVVSEQGSKATESAKDDVKRKKTEPKSEKVEKDKGGGFRGFFRRKKEK